MISLQRCFNQHQISPYTILLISHLSPPKSDKKHSLLINYSLGFITSTKFEIIIIYSLQNLGKRIMMHKSFSSKACCSHVAGTSPLAVTHIIIEVGRTFDFLIFTPEITITRLLNATYNHRMCFC